jgi:hypothetical protein
MDPVVVAGVQPNLLNGLFVHLVKAVQCLTGAEWIQTRFGQGFRPRYDQCSGWHHLASDLGHHADLFGNQGKSLFSLGLVDICNYFLYTKTKLVRQITIRLDLLSIHFENIT